MSGMDVLGEWIMTLVLLAAGGSILQQVTPEGSTKKYVSFVMAMILLNGLLYPLKLLQ